MKTLTVLIAGLVVSAAAATAAPTVRTDPGASSQLATPVANGCGRGWHWSPIRRRCVRNW